MSQEQPTSGSNNGQAIELERQFNWLGASQFYERTLKDAPNGAHERIGNTLELKAYSLHKAAMQADTEEQFDRQMREAIEAYATARREYERASGAAVPGWIDRCDAMTWYMKYWLATSPSEKKESIDNAWKTAKSSLSVFESAGKPHDFAVTFNQLSYAAAISYNYDGNSESRENTLREALSYAKKSARHLAPLNDPVNVARAHAKATGLLVAIEKDFATFAEKDRMDLDAWNHWLKAKESSEEAALSEIPYMVILQSWPAACGTEERTAIYSKGKEVADRSRDRFVIGCVLDGLAQRKFLMAMSSDDDKEIESLSKEGFEVAKASHKNMSMVRFTSPNVICVWNPVPEAGYYFSFSSEERDPEAKRDLLYKAHKPCLEQLKLAMQSGYPDVRCAAYFMLGSVLKGLGKTESGIDMKRSYLEHAVENLTQAINEDRLIHPYQYYPQGLDLLNLAEAHFEIAQITTNPEKRASILREAVTRKQEALGLCEKELNATQDTNPDISGEIAEGYKTTGDWAKELCSITGDHTCLGLVAECLEKAVQWFGKAGLSSQSAETNWEVAQTYDQLGEYLKSAERFDLASEDYRKAAESVPRLDEFYADHAIYMRAWGEIERARYHHMRQEPGLAKDCYENASAMHKSSRRWSYLTTNYSAWAKVEQAEDLSRSENYEESVKAFESAARLFQESKKTLHDQLTKIGDPAEKDLARTIERAADTRSNYCKARIVLEKARTLGKLGDASATADKYGQGASMFERILADLVTDQDKREIQLIAKLSRAWESMAKAEAETSPAEYEKASQLFEEAKELSTGEKPKLLMTGHSRFCKALGIGAGFVDTGDIKLHAEATKYLESAADCYLKADHQKESDYAKASKLLFDGYIHMGRASREDDQVKKAKIYMMAEKILKTSASAYEKAKEPKKKDQVLRLLEKVKEERELALSLIEMLHAPDLVSATAAFPSPSPSHESATGRERFEHADVQVALIAHPKSLHVGQDLEVVVEMTNAGKGVAHLVSVNNIVPREFSVVTKPDTCKVEDNNLHLRGMKLDALSSEIIKLVLKPSAKGKYVIKPHVVYRDEAGNAKDHKPEPVEITVKEMGISGWLKGT